jgi:hypothetical protein
MPKLVFGTDETEWSRLSTQILAKRNGEKLRLDVRCKGKAAPAGLDLVVHGSEDGGSRRIDSFWFTSP